MPRVERRPQTPSPAAARSRAPVRARSRSFAFAFDFALAPALALLLSACSDPTGSWPSAGQVPAAVERAAAGITAASARAHVSVLADDSMLGRWTPSRGLALSAGYIAGQFGRFGLTGAFGGAFHQAFPCTGVAEADWPVNVGAILRGSDPRRANEWIVLTAHYDHLGVRDTLRPDSIMNGADDNASGTAALLEAARTLAGVGARPARTIAFLAVAGEESGLIGSEWFVAHAPAGAHLVANLNLDMLGHNDPGVLYVSGDSLSSLGVNAQTLAAHYRALGLSLLPETIGAYGRSDQHSFAAAGVPALFFTAGIDTRYYHQPGDEVAVLDADKIARVARLAAYVVYDVASREAAPAWTAAGERATQTFRPYGRVCAAPAS